MKEEDKLQKELAVHAQNSRSKSNRAFDPLRRNLAIDSGRN